MPWLLKVITTSAVLTLFIDLFIGWRLRQVLKRAEFRMLRPVSIKWLIFCLVIQIYPAWCLLKFHLWGDAEVYEEPPAWMIYLFWFGLAFSAQLISWLLLADFIHGVVRFRAKTNKQWFDKMHLFVYMGIFMTVFSYTLIRMYLDTTRIKVEHITHQIDQLPEDLEYFKIIHVSDVQADRFTGADKIGRFVKKINAENPDLVLFTGDLVSWGTKYIEMGARQIGNIKAAYGVYAVLGDHDYWAGTDTVRTALEKYSIPFLDNKTLKIKAGDQRIGLTGISQIYDQRVSNIKLNQLLEEGKATELRILFSHQINSRIMQRAQSQDYHLALAGHTHGGQLAPALFFWPLSAPMLETEFVSGDYVKSSLLVNINNGLGYTLAPVRLHARAEITVITLTR